MKINIGELICGAIIFGLIGWFVISIVDITYNIFLYDINMIELWVEAFS